MPVEKCSRQYLTSTLQNCQDHENKERWRNIGLWSRGNEGTAMTKCSVISWTGFRKKKTLVEKLVKSSKVKSGV